MAAVRPRRLEAKDATLSRWRSRVRIPSGAPVSSQERRCAATGVPEHAPFMPHTSSPHASCLIPSRLLPPTSRLLPHTSSPLASSPRAARRSPCASRPRHCPRCRYGRSAAAPLRRLTPRASSPRAPRLTPLASRLLPPTSRLLPHTSCLSPHTQSSAPLNASS